MVEVEDFGHGVVVSSGSMYAVLEIDGRQVRTYEGETAWSDANRDAFDVVLKRVHG